MSILTLSRRTSSSEGGILAVKIRTFIAEHLRVEVDSIGVDSHFRDDLGLDLLDVVELTILVEEEFVNREFEDANEEMEFVGDLIHHIEGYQPGSSQDHIPAGARQLEITPPRRSYSCPTGLPDGSGSLAE
jgi:acyl carrier protein